LHAVDGTAHQLLQPDSGGAGASSKAQLIDEYLGVSLDFHGAAFKEEKQSRPIAACLELVACLEFHTGNSRDPGCRTLLLYQYLSARR
jgi:hypothetical protein